MATDGCIATAPLLHRQALCTTAARAIRVAREFCRRTVQRCPTVYRHRDTSTPAGMCVKPSKPPPPLYRSAPCATRSKVVESPPSRHSHCYARSAKIQNTSCRRWLADRKLESGRAFCGPARGVLLRLRRSCNTAPHVGRQSRASRQAKKFPLDRLNFRDSS